MRDEQWAARRKLVLHLNPAAAQEAKAKAGGMKGAEHVKKGGRGKKKETPAADSAAGVSRNQRASDQPNARAEAAALRRVKGSSDGTWAVVGRRIELNKLLRNNRAQYARPADQIFPASFAPAT